MTFTPEQRAGDFVRFMRQVQITGTPGDCWRWTGNAPDGRYGHFTVKGEHFGAHRWIFETVVGPIPEGLILRHRCDNPWCVNPQHLEPGTHADNTRDKFDRGRAPDRKGSRHPLARLSEDDIIRIRDLAAGGQRQADLADRYGMSRQQIGKIVRRQNWSHV